MAMTQKDNKNAVSKNKLQRKIKIKEIGTKDQVLHMSKKTKIKLLQASNKTSESDVASADHCDDDENDKMKDSANKSIPREVFWGRNI